MSRRQLGVLLAVVLVLAACSQAVPRGTAALAGQKTLVELATKEAIKVRIQGKMPDADWAQLQTLYRAWAASETETAQALADWRAVASADNEARLSASMNQTAVLADQVLALDSKYVDMDEMRARAKVHP